jgi:hypothetical protein
MNSRRRVNSIVMPRRLFENQGTSDVGLVVAMATIARARKRALWK